MSDLETLAREAEGDSVTAARLRGDEEYFPDCRPFLLDGQQPEHLVLLTTMGSTVLMDQFTQSGESSLDAIYGGVLVLARDVMLTVVDDQFVELSYGSMNSVGNLLGKRLEVHTAGIRYRFYVADSADESEVEAGIEYLRRRFREDAAGG